MDELIIAITSISFLVITCLIVSHAWRSWWPDAITPMSYISASIAVLALTGGLVALWGMSQAAFALAFASGVVLGILLPPVALVFFVACAVIRPWEFGHHPDMLFIPKFLGALGFVSWIFHGLKNRTFQILWNWPTRLFLMLALWIALSIFASGDVEAGFTAYKDTVLIAAAIFLITANVLIKPQDVTLLSRILVVSVTCVVAVAMTRTAYIARVDDRLEGFGLMGNANDLASLIVLAAPFAIFPAIARRTPVNLLMALASSLVFAAGLVLSQSRGAFLAIFAAMAALYLGKVALRNGARRALLSAMLIAPVLAIGLLSLNLARDSEDLNQSSQSRFNYALAGLNMAIRNPVLGVGFNNYPKLYERYSVASTYEWGERTAHSSWVLAMSETGFPGLILLLSLYGLVLQRSWNLRVEHPALLTSVVGYGLTMSFLSHTYIFFPYLLFGLVLAASKIHGGLTQAIPVKTGPSSKRNSPVKRIPYAPVAAVLMALSASSSDSHAAVILEATQGGQKPTETHSTSTAPKLSLMGSRGETLGFFIKLKADACGPLKLTGFKGTSPKLRAFSMPKIRIEQPSFPGAKLGSYYDPLLPADLKKICPETPGTLTWFWVDLEIPAEMKRGTYKGALEFGPSPGQTRLPISLKVWKMKMPEVATFPAYSELTSWYSLLGHYGKWHEGEEILAQSYIKEMQNHRIYPVKSFVAPTEVVRVNGKPELELTRKPSPALSFSSVTLKQRPKQIYFDFPTVMPDKIALPTTPEYFKAMENSLSSLGRPGKAMVYLWDEPTKEEMGNVLALAKIAKENAPSVKVMVTTTIKPELEKFVDIFVPVMDHFDSNDHPKLDSYRRFQAQGAGKEVWWYVSCMSHGCDALMDSGTPDFMIERPASYIRSISWISAKYGINAFLYYSVNNAYRRHPKVDPWTSLWDFSGNGDGTLFYPGRPGERGLTAHQPIPSIRLKLWRESSFDAEYLAWMKKLANPPSWLSKELARLAPNTRKWQRDYSEYQKLRDKIGEYLDHE